MVLGAGTDYHIAVFIRTWLRGGFGKSDQVGVACSVFTENLTITNTRVTRCDCPPKKNKKNQSSIRGTRRKVKYIHLVMFKL
jgi:hypothetical protein